MENHVQNFKCPFCEGEMKKGYIQSGTRLAWVPRVSKAIIEPSFIKDSVLLSKQSRFLVSNVDAYLCERCKKVVLDYS
ncbi:PF20097 family protein [Sporosarcina contaminans]|uniref:PF20097 family protein n=2 Tax=Sporosarcina TaxID=1569 RepID=A0ABW3TY52_9BACL